MTSCLHFEKFHFLFFSFHVSWPNLRLLTFLDLCLNKVIWGSTPCKVSGWAPPTTILSYILSKYFLYFALTPCQKPSEDTTTITCIFLPLLSCFHGVLLSFLFKSYYKLFKPHFKFSLTFFNICYVYSLLGSISRENVNFMHTRLYVQEQIEEN